MPVGVWFGNTFRHGFSRRCNTKASSCAGPFAIPRFSEDLAFSLLESGDDVGFRAALIALKRVFEREGYRVEVKVSEQKTVATAWVKFPGLPYELGLSPRATQKIGRAHV